MRSDELQQAFVRTLAYSLVFRAPLHFWQVRSYLLSSHFFSDEEMKTAWQDLSAKRHFGAFLAGENSIITRDQQRTRQQKWREVQKAVRWFRLIPWISSVWVTGSLAIGNAKKGDDLDFLIVTQNNRLWITRMLVILIGLVTQKLRWHNSPRDQVRDRWCCNLWLELSNVSLPDTQNLYTARELVQAWPVYQSGVGEARRFVTANTWVREYSFLGWQTAYNRAQTLLPRPPLFSFSPSFLTSFWNGVNGGAYRLQKWYMRPHQRNEKITSSKAFFHPEDRGAIVEAEYERIVTQLHKNLYGHTSSKNHRPLSIPR